MTLGRQQNERQGKALIRYGRMLGRAFGCSDRSQQLQMGTCACSWASEAGVAQYTHIQDGPECLGRQRDVAVLRRITVLTLLCMGSVADFGERSATRKAPQGSYLCG